MATVARLPASIVHSPPDIDAKIDAVGERLAYKLPSKWIESPTDESLKSLHLALRLGFLIE